MTTQQLTDQAWGKYPWTYRNNRGCVKTPNGFIRFGIPEPNGKHEDENAMKGGDRLGFTSLTVTPDMVGKTIAIFVNIEIKGEGDTLKPGQIAFHNFVLEHGGISEIWDNGEVNNSRIDE